MIRPPRTDNDVPIWRRWVQGILNGAINFSPTVSVGAPQTGDFTLSANDDTVFADGTSNTVTVTLMPASDVTGRKFEVKCVEDTFAVNITPSGSETIDGDAGSFQMFKHEIATLLSDGSNWWLVR